MPKYAELQLYLVAGCPPGGLDDAAWSKAPADLISDLARAANSASCFSEHAHNFPRQAKAPDFRLCKLAAHPAAPLPFELSLAAAEYQAAQARGPWRETTARWL